MSFQFLLLTNYSYFNLTGQGLGDVLNHKIMINSDKFTINDKLAIPTGEIAQVKNTPMEVAYVLKLSIFLMPLTMLIFLHQYLKQMRNMNIVPYINFLLNKIIQWYDFKISIKLFKYSDRYLFL